MELVEQYWEYIKEPEQWIEIAGRTCYKSEDKITPDSEDKFIRMLRDRGHHAMLEHSVAAVRFITNRGFTHELVRHRLAAFAQESTRYVRYGDIEIICPVWWDWMEDQAPITIERKGMPDIKNAEYHAFNIMDAAEVALSAEAIGLDTSDQKTYQNSRFNLMAGIAAWLYGHMVSEWSYTSQLDLGYRPEQARGVLPQDLKAEIVITCNLREWRHIFAMRAAKAAHPQIRYMMNDLLLSFRRRMPAVFDDLHGTMIEE